MLINERIIADKSIQYAEYLKHNRVKKGLGSNLKPANLFLKPNLLDLLKEIYIPSRHYYHVTQYKNIPSIMKIGLQPVYGGKSGCSKRVGLPIFKHFSQGRIHASINALSNGLYINLYEKSSENTLKNLPYKKTFKPPQNLGDSPIVLRFKKRLPRVKWRLDYHDRYAVSTNNPILPQYIEALTTEGWVQISKLTELEKALGC